MDDNIAQPGQTVAPGSADTPAPPPAAPQAAPEPAPPADPKPATAPGAEPPSEDSQQFQASVPGIPSEISDPEGSVVTWTASEFIAHAKSSGWYAALATAAVVTAAGIYLFTRDPVSSGVIIVAAACLGIYAGHKPRELEYRVDFKGLTIGGKHFTFDQFQSFSVMQEGAFSSIVFMPLKRFGVPTTIYYAPEDEDKIVNLLSDHLPLENRGHDAVDRLMHRIHF